MNEQPQPLEQRTFSPKEVAEWLGVGTDTVLGWIHNGSLPAFDCSREQSRKPRWRIMESELQGFIERRTKQQPIKPTRRPRKPTNIIEFYK